MQDSAVTVSRPPGPRPFPLLGHFPAMRRDVLGFFADCARDYGDVVGLRLGRNGALLVSAPRDIEQVLVREHKNFCKQRFFWNQLTAVFGSGLLTSEGDLWLRQRRLAAPAFSGERLFGYGDTIVTAAMRMLEGWKDGEERSVHADMMGLALQIAARTLFGTDVEEDVADIEHALDLAMPEITARVVRPVHIPDAVPLPGHIRYRRGLRTIERLVARIIEERRARPHETGDLIAMLLQARDENGEPMSDRQLRDEVVTTLLAGHETTALALSWTLYLLGHHPDVDAELAAEIDAVVGDRPVTVEDLGNLVFTERIVKESMRLYPPAWTIGREALNDCVIGTYSVAKGTIIFMSQWVLHRDARHFEDPTSFRPERWTKQFERDLPRFAYFPFGGGPRVCIGSRFAMMEAMLILVTVRQRFRWVWTGDRPIRPIPSITLRPSGGVRVRLSDAGAPAW
jgi:cytochrome P450